MKTFYDSALDTLRKIIDQHFGGNVAKASKALGLESSVLLHQWMNGRRSPTLLTLGPIFDQLGISLHVPGEEILDFDFIPKVAAKAGAGSSLETSGETLGLYAFRKDYITQQGIHVRSSILLEIVGDSMEPLLRSGDTILVDKSDKEVQDGKTYLVAYGDDLKVKHIFKTPRGLILRSENQRYADVLIEPEELGTFAVVHGRVRWFGRMM